MSDIDPHKRRKKERMCLMGHICSLLFSLPKDKIYLNNDMLFLVTRFTHSYTLIITNYQLVLNTSMGLAFKILSIKGLRMLILLLFSNSKPHKDATLYCMNHPTLKTWIYMLCVKNQSQL